MVSSVERWNERKRAERKAREAEAEKVSNADASGVALTDDEKRARRTAGLIPFKPGQSGNPAGRPGLPPDVRMALTKAVPKATKRLVQLLDDPDGRLRLAAAEVIYNRLYGKPVQAVEAKVETTVQSAHLQILLELQGKRDGVTIEGTANPAEIDAESPMESGGENSC